MAFSKQTVQGILIGVALGTICGLAIGFSIGSATLGPSKITDPVLATYQGKPIRLSEISSQISPDLEVLKKNEYMLKRQAVENLIEEQVKSERPELRPKDTDLPAIEISDEEIAQFLKERQIVLNPGDTEARKNIIGNMRLRKMKSAAMPEIQKNLAEIKWMISPPTKVVNIGRGHFPQAPIETTFMEKIKNLSTKKTTIVAVGNFHCPFCLEAEKNFRDLRNRYGRAAEFYFQFLLNENDQSVAQASAEASYCADEQNRFWNFRDVIGLTPPSKPEDLLLAAKAAGLAEDKFQRCLSNRTYKEALEKDVMAVRMLGIGDAPTFVINGHLISGHAPMSEIEALLER